MKTRLRRQGILWAAMLAAVIAPIRAVHGQIVSDTRTLVNKGGFDADGMTGSSYFPQDNPANVALRFTSAELLDLNGKSVFKKAPIANLATFAWNNASPNYVAPNIVLKGEKATAGFAYRKGVFSIPKITLTKSPPAPDFSGRVEEELPTLQAVADADFQWDGLAQSLTLTISNFSGQSTRLDDISVHYNNSVGDINDPLSWQVTGTQLFGVPSSLDLGNGEIFSHTWTNLADFDIAKFLSIQSSETIDGEGGLDHLQAVLLPAPGALPMAWLGLAPRRRRRVAR